MDMGLFKNIIAQIKDHIELVYLAGGLGEPTIHPGLFKMIKYCRESKVRVGVSTNAVLLTPKVVDKLLTDPTDLILFSLDGATKETHEKVRVGSNFERTMGNVENFLKEKERRKKIFPYVCVQMVYMPVNQAEAEVFRKKWASYKGVNDIRMKKFLHLQGAEYIPASDDGMKIFEKMSCVLPWRQLSIAWDGTLALCCRDYNYREVIGSVQTSSVMELWNSSAMQKRRQLLSQGQKCDIGLCRGCAGLPTTWVMKLGAVLVDDLSIRKLLPLIEKITMKMGLKVLNYD
jgi:organic radical activating enzyme